MGEWFAGDARFWISSGQDYAAIKAAASLPWLNGPAKGNIKACAGRIVRHDKGAIPNSRKSQK
jgi:hypothetical protein